MSKQAITGLCPSAQGCVEVDRLQIKFQFDCRLATAQDFVQIMRRFNFVATRDLEIQYAAYKL